MLDQATDSINQMLRTFGFPLFWSYSALEAAAELIHHSFDPVYRGGNIRFGDGKPVVLVPGHLGGDVTLEPLSMWLHAVGYRPAQSNILININDRSLDEPLAAALRSAALRIGRKAVIIALDTGLRAALRVAEIERDFVSDVIALGLPGQLPPEPVGVRLHVIENAWRMPVAAGDNVHFVRGTRALLSINPETLRVVSGILRNIPITLLDGYGRECQ
jgi:hypothetical protein